MYGATLSFVEILKELLCPLPRNATLTNGCSPAPKREEQEAAAPPRGGANQSVSAP